jgi:hypothetical protein
MSGQLPADLEEALTNMDQDLEAIGKEFPAHLETERVPETIYHYTDDNGLRSIIQSGKLWCSDVFYLNDPSELRYAVSIATEMVAVSTMGGPPEARIFARDFQRYGADAVEGSAHYFVCSLSKNGNDLSQWRAYGANGRGYAIGFDGNKLERAFATKDGQRIQEHNSFPVSYDEARLRGIFKRLIDRVIPLISAPKDRGLSDDAVEEYMQTLRISLALQVYRTALFFKHSAYAAEEEYRLMQVHPADRPPNDVRFRSRPHTLLRYREFDWRSVVADSLTHIVIGPACDPRLSSRFVNDCLRAYFPTGQLHMRLSDIPYRP